MIDFHTHILPSEIIKNLDQYTQKDNTLKILFDHPKSKFATAELLIEKMNEYQICKSVVLGMGWTDPGLNSFINDYILDSANNSKGKIIPFTGINPCNLKSGINEAIRCIELGSKGFGEVHSDFQNFNINDKKLMEPYMRILEESNLPIVIHSSEPVGHIYPGKGSTTPEKLLKIIEYFPKNIFVLSHWGGGLFFYELMPEIAKSLKNVFYDCSASPLLYDSRIYEIALKIIDSKKLLFGSDFPLIEPSRITKYIDNLEIDKKQLDNIYWKNAQKILSV